MDKKRKYTPAELDALTKRIKEATEAADRDDDYPWVGWVMLVAMLVVTTTLVGCAVQGLWLP